MDHWQCFLAHETRYKINILTEGTHHLEGILTYALWLSSTPGKVFQARSCGGAEDVVILAALEGNLTANLEYIKKEEQ